MISQRIVYICLVAHAQPALALVAPPLLTAPRSVSCNIVTPLRGPAATDELEYGRGTMADLSSIVALAQAQVGFLRDRHAGLCLPEWRPRVLDAARAGRLDAGRACP